jgi:hypothetical protein
VVSIGVHLHYYRSICCSTVASEAVIAAMASGRLANEVVGRHPLAVPGVRISLVGVFRDLGSPLEIGDALPHLQPGRLAIRISLGPQEA